MSKALFYFIFGDSLLDIGYSAFKPQSPITNTEYPTPKERLHLFQPWKFLVEYWILAFP
jgi:hypothetical protein